MTLDPELQVIARKTMANCLVTYDEVEAAGAVR